MKAKVTITKPQSKSADVIYGGLQNTSHTTGSTAHTFGEAGKEIGAMNPEHSTAAEDLERLIACWNAMAGYTTEEVKQLFGKGGVKAKLTAEKEQWIAEIKVDGEITGRVGPFDCEGVADMFSQNYLEPKMLRNADGQETDAVILIARLDSPQKMLKDLGF